VGGFLIPVKRPYVQLSSPGHTEGLKVGCGGMGGRRDGWMGGRRDRFLFVCFLSNAVSSLTSTKCFFILTSLLTYTVPTEHHILPEKLAHTRTATVVVDIPFEVARINRLVS
jgi:hypothetical protein